MANNHLHIEEWLLSASSLTPEEQLVLQEHLKTCDSCRQLSEVWQEVEYQLKTAPVRSPEPGFTGRWQARLAQDQQRRQRRQAIYIMGLCGGIVLVLIVVLGSLAWPVVINPLPYLMVWGYQLTSTFYLFSGVGRALGTVLRTVLGLVPGSLWVAILVALGSLGVVWIVAFSKLTSSRRVVL
jgi:predicted anti-sigma-YlaC factor YlaD